MGVGCNNYKVIDGLDPITLLSKRGITNQHLRSIYLVGNRDIIIVLVKE